MSRDKQTEIHEIAKRMSEAIFTETEHRYISDERKLEAVLKENGWCKASDLAEEIFAEVQKALDISVETEHLKGSWFNMNKFMQSLTELKKKYTKGGKKKK